MEVTKRKRVKVRLLMVFTLCTLFSEFCVVLFLAWQLHIGRQKCNLVTHTSWLHGYTEWGSHARNNTTQACVFLSETDCLYSVLLILPPTFVFFCICSYHCFYVHPQKNSFKIPDKNTNSFWCIYNDLVIAIILFW